ncbi:lanthionine synthetase LanC family protein [Aquiflexum sp.]|uniref:lanthionine synthetase LanC family protein n=1 Tax=Aquiflexum sp. TaxID=1872584 RepID=UPI0035930A49
MGACLYFFEAFQNNKNPKYGQSAENILQEVYTFVHQNPVPTYFDNGLAGIAWGIHQLIKKGAVEGEANELLEQIDNILFKVISEKSEELEFGLKRGLLGYFLYVLDRLTPLLGQPPTKGYREIFTSLAILLLNRLHFLVEAQKANFSEPKQFNLFWDLPNYLSILAVIQDSRLLPEKTHRMLKDITPLVLSTLPQNLGNCLNMYWAINRLAVPDWKPHTGLLQKRLIDAPLSGFGLNNKSLYVENGLAGLILLDHQMKSDFGDFDGIFDQKDNIWEAFIHLERSEYWEYLSNNLDHELGLLYGITGINFSILHLSKEKTIIQK